MITSSDHVLPVIAEMEEASSALALETGLFNSIGRAPGQGRRVALLEDLRDGTTPIELDFSLQNPLHPQFNGFVTPVPGVTAISPQPVERPWTWPLPPFHEHPAQATPPAAPARQHRSLYVALIPAARQLGRRAGYFGRGVVLRTGGGVRKGSHMLGAAACLAAKAVARGALTAGRFSSGTAAATGSAVYCTAAAAAAQPVRLVRLIRRLPMHASLTQPLHAVLRLMHRWRQQQPAATTTPTLTTVDSSTATSALEPLLSVAAAVPSSTAPAPYMPVVAEKQAQQQVVLRARSLSMSVPVKPTGGAPRQVVPYERATAAPVPTLLLPDVVGCGSEGVSITAVGAAAPPPPAPTARRRSGGSSAGRRVPRRRGAAAISVVSAPARVLLFAATSAVIVAKYTAAAMLCAFFPKACRFLGAAALISTPSLTLPPPLPLLPGLRRLRWLRLWRSRRMSNPLMTGPLRPLFSPLGPLRGPFVAFAVLRVVGPLVAPSVWRNAMYWQRTVPIVARYMVTSRRAEALRSRGQWAAAEEIWQRQHEWGAGALFDMLADLKGFYLKLGQILASKTDMLPRPYTESLSRLLDRLPPAPYRSVRRTIEMELGAPPDFLFRDVDPFPLASATIAQVHRAQLPDRRAVVVKVQHPGARAMMRSDLANLATMSHLLDAAGLRLGFDHGSLVREYNVQVPLEFDFGREARVAASIRSSLLAAAQTFPALRRVVIPRMVPSHSGGRVLTMEYLDGVPLLDIAGMDLAVRHGLMTSLILAYGIMILRDGLFHSDPHPGNLLAMRRGRRTAPSSPSEATSVSIHSGAAGVRPLTASDAWQQQQQWQQKWRSEAFAAGAAQSVEMTHGLMPGPPSSPSTADTDELLVALLDFGQAKQLSSASRARYAMLVAAMAVRDDDLVLAVSAELGLVVDGCSREFAAVATYILYDTRMDMPEAHMGPLHPDAHEFRSAKVPSLPQDLFMVMRTITLLRGLLSSLGVNVSAAQLWRPLALQVLADLAPVHHTPTLAPDYEISAPDTAAQMEEDLAAVELLDFEDDALGGVSGLGGLLPQSTTAAATVLSGAVRRGSIGGGGAALLTADRRRIERDAAEAARKREEARRRADWEEANRRKKEEREAKARRQKEAKDAAAARKKAERLEREKRKQKEIVASNARRRTEREPVEGEQLLSRSSSIEGWVISPPATGSASASASAMMRLPTEAMSASKVSPLLPPTHVGAETEAGPAAAMNPGRILSPVPVRVAPPYSAANVIGIGSRLLQMAGLRNSNDRYGNPDAAIRVNNAVADRVLSPLTPTPTINDVLTATESSSSTAYPMSLPGLAAAATLPPSSNLRTDPPRVRHALTPALTTPWDVQPLIQGGTAESTPITATIPIPIPRPSLKVALQAALMGALPSAAVGVSATGGGGGGGASTAATSATTANGGGGGDGKDDVTARLMGPTSQVTPPASYSGPRQRFPAQPGLMPLRADVPTGELAAGSAAAVDNTTSATRVQQLGPGTTTPLMQTGRMMLQDERTSEMSVQQQQLDQLQQLQQQLVVLQQQQQQQSSVKPRSPEIGVQRGSLPPLSPPSLPPSQTQRAPSGRSSQERTATAAWTAVRSPPSVTRTSTAPDDLVAQARALLDTTRKLIPPSGSAASGVRASAGGGSGSSAAATFTALLSNARSGKGSAAATAATPTTAVSLPTSIISGGEILASTSGGSGGRGGAQIGGASGSNDSEAMVSKRTGRHGGGYQSPPPAMFLPSGMRAAAAGGGSSGAVSQKSNVEMLNLVSEIEPVPVQSTVSQTRMASQLQIQNQNRALSATAAAGEVNGGGGGGLDGRMDFAAIQPNLDRLAVVDSLVEPQALASLESTANPRRQLRTTDSLVDDDNGMWLARQQKLSQPNSETYTAQVPTSPSSQLSQQPSASPTASAMTVMQTPPSSQLPPLLGNPAEAATVSDAGFSGGGAGGVPDVGTVSSAGSKPMGAAQKPPPSSKGPSSGLGSMKKGLSRIGKRIVNGLV